jgi:uncharacterized membrane-anchored protein YjiN (DUF445 family)
MSFRLNHYQLARALRILITLEPNQPISSLSQAAKLIIIDWISKHSINTSLDTSQADIDAIKLIEKLPANQINPYTTIQSAMAKTNYQPSQSAQMQKQVQKTTEQIALELEQEKFFNQCRQESAQKAQADQKAQETLLNTQINATFNQVKPSAFHDPNITDSVISSVTDFSPPPEWKNLD